MTKFSHLPGIDYGSGRTNVDFETGIRYGVISQHTILQAWADDSEPDYGPATCPKCGNEAVSLDSIGPDDTDIPSDDESEIENWTAEKHECRDYACRSCKHFFGSESAFSDNPQCFTYQGQGYAMADCLDSDVMICKAPYFTRGAFCSPCVPGAVNLNDANNFNDVHDSACDDAILPRAYCCGHDWFDPPVAPYRVFSVLTGREVFPDLWYCEPWSYNVVWTQRDA